MVSAPSLSRSPNIVSSRSRHQKNFPAKQHDTPLLVWSSLYFRNMAAQVANGGGGGGGGNAAFKVRCPLPIRAVKTLIDKDCRTRRSPELFVVPISLQQEVGIVHAHLLEDTANTNAAAVADAIRTVCATTRCGEGMNTNVLAVFGAKGYGQDGM